MQYTICEIVKCKNICVFLFTLTGKRCFGTEYFHYNEITNSGDEKELEGLFKKKTKSISRKI